MKKTTRTATKTTAPATAPARKKLALKKDVLKDLGARPKASAVKGGANYSRAISGAL